MGRPGKDGMPGRNGDDGDQGPPGPQGEGDVSQPGAGFRGSSRADGVYAFKACSGTSRVFEPCWRPTATADYAVGCLQH